MNNEWISEFFEPGTPALGPPINDVMVASAERTLGYRLPSAYVALLRARNGGRPQRRCYATAVATSWAPDRIEISDLIGMGYDDGIDGATGSRYMISEWGYP